MQDAIAYAKVLAAEEAYGKGREEGKAEGRKEGKKEGMMKGIEKGREEGREEGMEQARRLMALNMLERGLDIALISSVTRLSEDEIRRIAE